MTRFNWHKVSLMWHRVAPISDQLHFISAALPLRSAAHVALYVSGLRRACPCVSAVVAASRLHCVQMLTSCYQGRLFAECRDAATVFTKRMDGRRAVHATATPDSARAAARRIVHHPCRQRHTVVFTTTETFGSRVLANVISKLPTVAVVLAAVAVVASVVFWRARSRR